MIEFFATIIFEKIVQPVGYVWQHAKRQRAMSQRVFACSTSDSSPCATKVEEDSQVNELIRRWWGGMAGSVGQSGEWGGGPVGSGGKAGGLVWDNCSKRSYPKGCQ